MLIHKMKMKTNTKSLTELKDKMSRIAEANNLTLEQFKKLPRQKFIQMCNQFNNK